MTVAMIHREHLSALIAPAVEALGYELWHVELSSQGSQKLLRVLVESESGINMGALAEVSRQISALLDVEDPVSDRYLLEVSSPGMDRPLVKQSHYQRSIGKRVRIRLHMLVEQSRQWEGLLIAVEGEQVTLELPSGTRSFHLPDIDKANLVPVF